MSSIKIRQIVVLVLTLLVCYSGEGLGKAENWKENCPKKKLAGSEVRRRGGVEKMWKSATYFFVFVVDPLTKNQ